VNRIIIQAEEEPLPAWAKTAEDFLLRALERLEKENWDLSVFFCEDAYMRALNLQFGKKDEATDILSFEMGESVIEENGEKRFLAGDLVISLETLYENAKYFGVTPDEELKRLLIHGILHLSGMDHTTNADTEPMLLFQELLVAELGGRILL
jgi:probable rRNA maturation factor